MATIGMLSGFFTIECEVRVEHRHAEEGRAEEADRQRHLGLPERRASRRTEKKAMATRGMKK